MMTTNCRLRNEGFLPLRLKVLCHTEIMRLYPELNFNPVFFDPRFRVDDRLKRNRLKKQVISAQAGMQLVYEFRFCRQCQLWR